MVKDDLTPKQEKFCQEMSKLGNQRQAYKNAYSTKGMSENSIDREASVLMKNPKVTQRLKELAQKSEDEAILDAKEAQKILTKIARGEADIETPIVVGKNLKVAVTKVTPKDITNAINSLAKMRGWNDIKVKIENAPQIINNVPRGK